MANTPDTIFVTGSDFRQLTPQEVLVTRTGGTQQTLSAALATAPTTLTGTITGSPNFDKGISTSGTIVPANNQNTFINNNNVVASLGSSGVSGNAVVAGSITTLTVTGTTGTFTSGAHTVGQGGELILSLGAVTVPTAFGQEALFNNSGASTTVTQGIVHGAHMVNSGTITALMGYMPFMASGDNTGTVTQMTDFFSPSLSGVTGAPATRYCIQNQDPSKLIASAGQYVNSTLQEMGPTPGMGYVSGRYYFGITPVSVTPISLPANVAVLAPFFCKSRQAFTKLGCRITTGVAASHVQLAIYNVASGVATTLITNTASLSSAAAGIAEATISVTLDAGNYVLALVTDAAISINGVVDAGGGVFFYGATTDNGFEIQPSFGLTLGSAWPNNPSLAYSPFGAVPQIWLRP